VTGPGLDHPNTLNDDVIPKHYIMNAKKIEKPEESEKINQLSSLKGEEDKTNKVIVNIQNDAPVLEEKSLHTSFKQNLNKSIKDQDDENSPDDEFFGSTEWLDSTENEDIFPADYSVLDGADDFFSDGFDEFDESPEVSIEPVGDLPFCSDLSDIETEIGVECIKEKRNRDEVLEKILSQVWDTLDISSTLEPLIGDSLDPLNISRAIPGGEVSVSEEGSVYQANLTMKDITMYNLGQVYLKKVMVTRSEDLTNMEVTAWIGLDLLSANGTYSINGMLGWWPVDSKGERSFHAEMYNATLAPRVRVDTRTGCDENGNAIITDLKIPLKYDEVSFHMDNLGEFYNSVVNGIGVFLISSQNELAVSALKGLIARSIASFAC